jgi:hypothetical protein
MRIRITQAGYALAAGVAVTAMLGMSVASAGAATKPALKIKNATNACGATCTDVHFLVPGDHALLGSHWGSDAAGNLVRLLNASNSAPREDFVLKDFGTIDTDYCAATAPFDTDGILTQEECAALNTDGMGTDTAFQLAFDPNNGGPEDECIGAVGPAPGDKMRLEPCGSHAGDTVMIETDTLNAGSDTTAGADWLVNADSSSFSNPRVATSDGLVNSTPTWSTVIFNGNSGEDTQEVRLAPGPYVI